MAAETKGVKLTGAQRLRQIRAKHTIKQRRELRDFMEGRISFCGGGDAKLFKAIEAEFDRVYDMAFAAGRSALAAHDGGQHGHGE